MTSWVANCVVGYIALCQAEGGRRDEDGVVVGSVVSSRASRVEPSRVVSWRGVACRIVSCRIVSCPVVSCVMMVMLWFPVRA